MAAPASSLRLLAVVFVAALTAAASQVSFPLPFTPVPFTLQPALVLLGGAVLGARLGASAQALYLALGLTGLPVFAFALDLPQGLLRLLGPSGGYLMAYPLAAFVTGAMAEPHGIFDTYFEIYEFQFDGSVVSINDTQPGKTGTGNGYKEFFDITINSLASGVDFLHFDLFTIEGAGQLGSTSLVQANAPFSHDAQTIPEPGSVAVFSIGLLVAGGLIRRARPKA